MPEVFKAKVRRIGNALGVIIPKNILETIKAREGDIIKLLIPMDYAERNKIIMQMAGSLKGAAPFKRERKDRF